MIYLLVTNVRSDGITKLCSLQVLTVPEEALQ